MGKSDRTPIDIDALDLSTAHAQMRHFLSEVVSQMTYFGIKPTLEFLLV